MRPSLQAGWSKVLFASLSLLALAGCPPPPPPPVDTTPPGLLSVDVQIIPRTGTSTPPPGLISILNGDVTRKLTKGQKIRIVANAGDPESGIGAINLATMSGTDGQGVTQMENLSFSCSTQPPLTGVLQLGVMAPTPSLGAISPPRSVASIDVTVDPVAQAGVCGGGTASLGGFIRLDVANGKGMMTSSHTFVFDFL